MGPSLSLAAYRAFVRRGPAPNYSPTGSRPEGELIWAHATSSARLSALIDLGNRLVSLLDGVNLLISYDPDLVPPAARDRAMKLLGNCIAEELPADHPATVARFLDHWLPNACIWTGGFLRPNLNLETSSRNIPTFLIDATSEGFDGRKERWFPEVSRHLLSGFSAVMASTQQAKRRLVSLGRPAKGIQLTAPLLAGGLPPPCDQVEADEFASHLSGRPVWLAAGIRSEEVPRVLSAHRQAARRAHRLLLIVVPADLNSQLPAQIAAQGFSVADWSLGKLPDDGTQVLVADSPDDLGLWYRLAPLAFIGSSLIPGYGGRDPFAAAALGSAILYGPNVGDHLEAYSRLAAAGAARIVKDADGLGTAVLRLIAPDLAASMAHSGWEVVSEGAALTDKVIDLVQTVLDERRVV
ncbi:MAG: glycosyltransferase N-terminal domain-containing protein [Paracoccaceae bacterium]